MSRPVAIFYHALFFHGAPPEFKVDAFDIVREQMLALKTTGLLSVAKHFVVGINGGKESEEFANLVIPANATRVMHGLESKSENLTLVELEKWAPKNPGWNVLYHHAKACTHAADSDYGKYASRWRRCMQAQCIHSWRRCVADLDAGAEAVGSHWLTQQGHDHSQHYFAGNFYWVKSEFFATIPSIFTRDRIKTSGISSLESRYEAEVILGNGPRLPIVKNYADHGIGACP